MAVFKIKGTREKKKARNLDDFSRHVSLVFAAKLGNGIYGAFLCTTKTKKPPNAGHSKQRACYYVLWQK